MTQTEGESHDVVAFSSQLTEPNKDWADHPYTSSQYMGFREVDGVLMPAAAISIQLAAHPDTPDDYLETLQGRLFDAVDRIITDSGDGEQDPTRDFNNFSVLHSLRLALAVMHPYVKTDNLEEKLDEFQLPSFIAPDGFEIEVEPNYAESREVPLYVEAWDEDGNYWRNLDSGHEDFEQVGHFYRQFEPYFIGHIIRYEDGETYIYNRDEQSRILIDNDVVFRLTQTKS